MRGSGRINQHQQREEQLGWRTIYRTKGREKIKEKKKRTKGQKKKNKETLQGSRDDPQLPLHTRALPGSRHSQEASAATGGTNTKNAHLEPELGNAPRAKGHSCPSQPHKHQMLWECGKGTELSCLGPAPHPVGAPRPWLRPVAGPGLGNQEGNSPS